MTSISASVSFSSVQSYLGVGNSFQAQISSSMNVGNPALGALLDQFSRLATPGLSQLGGAPGQAAGALADPLQALGRSMIGDTYRSQEQLQSEPVQQTCANSQAKKGGSASQSVNMSPQDVEKKLLTDPAFRAKMEQKVGGRIMLDGNPDGKITVERNIPPGVQRQAGMAGAMAIAGHLNRMENTFPHALGSMMGNPMAQGMPTDPRQLYNQFAQQALGGAGFPGNALQQAYQSGFRDGFLGGCAQSQLPGFLQGYGCGGAPNAQSLAGPLGSMLDNVLGMQGCMSATITAHLEATATVRAWDRV